MNEYFGEEVDKRNFRRKMSVLGILKPLGEHRTCASARATLSFRVAALASRKLKDRKEYIPVLTFLDCGLAQKVARCHRASPWNCHACFAKSTSLKQKNG
jgi:hypothetical protein